MRKILIIDDDFVIREILNNHFSRAGYDVLMAEDGREGLELFRKHTPRVVILDVEMAGMNGIDFLKELEPEEIYNHAITVLTARESTEKIEQCFSLGAQAFLIKPVNLSALNGLITHSFHAIESSLKAQEFNHRLATILQNIPELVWECDEDFYFTYVSKNALDILGYSAEFLLGKPLNDYIATGREVGELFSPLKNENTSNIQELLISAINHEGHHLPLVAAAQGIYDENGVFKGMVATCRNGKFYNPPPKENKAYLERNRLRIDQSLQLQYIGTEILSSFQNPKIPQDFTPYIEDQSLLSLFPMAFEQEEDMPFPIIIQLLTPQGINHCFSIHFQYIRQGNYLEGELQPIA